MKSEKKEFKALYYFKVIFLSLIVVFIGLYFMSQKENMDFDEVCTFGLANNTYQLQVEDFKEYDGEKLLLDYAAVKDGEEFNVKNVFLNQTMDTHPPLYYLLVNFICSLRKGTFSMWYGLIINLVFMVILFWELRYLLTLVIDDRPLATFFSLWAFTFYGFVNEIVFIRMYVMLSVVSLAFIILVLDEMKREREDIVSISFLAKFFLICILGILTQYHFIFIAFFFSVVFALYLYKNKKYKTLLSTFATGVLSIVISIIIFPGMINHIFGEGSLHAVNSVESAATLAERFYELLASVNQAFFDKGIFIYLPLLIIGIILYVSSKDKNKKVFDGNETTKYYYLLFLVCCIYYYIVVSLTAKYSFGRYLYNVYPLLYIVFITPIYYLYKRIAPMLKFICIATVIVLSITSKFDRAPFSLNVGDTLFCDYLSANSDTKVFMLYRSLDKNGRANTQLSSLWKIQRPLYTFRNMKSLIFVDLSSNKSVLTFNDERISSNEKIYLVTYPPENDEELLSRVMQNNLYTSYQKIYFTTYFHMYLLTK